MMTFYICIMNFIKITFPESDVEEQEKLIAMLSNFNFEGFEQTDIELLAYIENDLFNQDDVQALLYDYAYEKEQLPNINWNEKWESDFEPIIIENEVAIRADFHEEIGETKHEIIITPKMSFGTGHHATTQLMLEQMSGINFTNKKVWDYGTGTGVLAIYAEKLGAKEIIANDIDPWSEENARENIARNNCLAVNVRLGGLEVVPEDGFDIILANINLSVLRDDVPILLKKLKKSGGTLVISGVLEEKKQDIIEIIKSYKADYKVFIKDKWLSIVAKI